MATESERSKVAAEAEATVREGIRFNLAEEAQFPPVAPLDGMGIATEETPERTRIEGSTVAQPEPLPGTVAVNNPERIDAQERGAGSG